jgi:hypothetical protein
MIPSRTDRGCRALGMHAPARLPARRYGAVGVLPGAFYKKPRRTASAASQTIPHRQIAQNTADEP